MSDPTIRCPHGRSKRKIAYFRLFEENASQGLRAVLCQDCFDQLVQELDRHTYLRSEAPQVWSERPWTCDWDHTCHNEADGRVLLVITYPNGHAREDRLARLCEEHGSGSLPVGLIAL